MRFKYILFFLLILPLTLSAQLTKNERYWLNYHLTTDPKLAEYSSELHNKFLNDPSNLAQLKQCTNSLIYQRIGESLLGFNTLTDLADHVSEQYGEEYTREIIPNLDEMQPYMYGSMFKCDYPCGLKNADKYAELVNTYASFRKDKVKIMDAYTSTNLINSNLMDELRTQVSGELDKDDVGRITLWLENGYVWFLLKEAKTKLQEKGDFAKNDFSFCHRMMIQKLDELKNKNKRDFTGKWSTEWGKMNLIQTNGKVTGTYDWSDGKIDGGVTESGDTLICRGKWTQSNGKGEFIFKLFGSDRFDGSYNYSTSAEYWHEDWNGTRLE